MLTLLTEIKVKSAKLKEKDYRMPDGHAHNPARQDERSQAVEWRYRFQGKEQTMSFGAYPIITLVAAREAHMEARRTLADGADPMAQRKEEKKLGRLWKQRTSSVT